MEGGEGEMGRGEWERGEGKRRELIKIEDLCWIKR
jgi:hypothetical protein